MAISTVMCDETTFVGKENNANIFLPTHFLHSAVVVVAYDHPYQKISPEYFHVSYGTSA